MSEGSVFTSILGQVERIQLYEPSSSSTATNYTVDPIYEFSDDERTELQALLRVRTNPYTEYGAYLDEVANIARKAPAFLLRAVDEACRADLRRRPVLYFKNCPTGHVPELDYDDPLNSKYARKTDYVAEAFHTIFAQLHGTASVTYRSANRGDMFHDVTPMRSLASTITQRTLNTLHFHFNLPNHKVRPDWVYLLSLRNSRRNVVFTPIVRLADALEQLDPQTLDVLKRPLFAQPRPGQTGDIPQYGLPEKGYYERGPLLVDDDDGAPSLRFFEGCHVSDDPEGIRALESLRAVLHRSKYDLFLEERDFVAISNHDSMHARHVVEINDVEAHRRRWILKTWVVDDLEQHRQHFMNGRTHTSDE